jgi:hypothetical protein
MRERAAITLPAGAITCSGCGQQLKPRGNNAWSCACDARFSGKSEEEIINEIRGVTKLNSARDRRTAVEVMENALGTAYNKRQVSHSVYLEGMRALGLKK